MTTKQNSNETEQDRNNDCIPTTFRASQSPPTGPSREKVEFWGIDQSFFTLEFPIQVFWLKNIDIYIITMKYTLIVRNSGAHLDYQPSGQEFLFWTWKRHFDGNQLRMFLEEVGEGVSSSILNDAFLNSHSNFSKQISYAYPNAYLLSDTKNLNLE